MLLRISNRAIVRAGKLKRRHKNQELSLVLVKQETGYALGGRIGHDNVELLNVSEVQKFLKKRRPTNLAALIVAILEAGSMDTYPFMDLIRKNALPTSMVGRTIYFYKDGTTRVADPEL